MVAKRVHTPCPPSARTTTEISELTVMISGLVQRQALLTGLLTGLLRNLKKKISKTKIKQGLSIVSLYM